MPGIAAPWLKLCRSLPIQGLSSSCDMTLTECPMKTMLVTALLLLAPLGAHAACSATSFSIQDFKIRPVSGGFGPRVSLSGQLVNNCASPAAAEIRIVAKDANGNVLATKQGWPAGTSNIAPGKSVNFDLGRLFRYQPGMQAFTASIGSVRTW